MMLSRHRKGRATKAHHLLRCSWSTPTRNARFHSRKPIADPTQHPRTYSSFDCRATTTPPTTIAIPSDREVVLWTQLTTNFVSFTMPGMIPTTATLLLQAILPIPPDITAISPIDPSAMINNHHQPVTDTSVTRHSTRCFCS